MDWADLSALAALFGAASGAATILPFQSEFIFAAVQLGTDLPIALIILVASIGNTLGSVVNYVLGRFIESFQDSRWFPVGRRQMLLAERWYARWGVWTLLLSWAPFGDGFTVVAGIMRTNLWLFLALVAAAKTGRYVVLAWALA